MSLASSAADHAAEPERFAEDGFSGAEDAAAMGDAEVCDSNEL